MPSDIETKGVDFAGIAGIAGMSRRSGIYILGCDGPGAVGKTICASSVGNPQCQQCQHGAYPWTRSQRGRYLSANLFCMSFSPAIRVSFAPLNQ